MDSLTMTFEIQCKFFFSMLSSPCVIFRTLCYGLNCILLKTIRRRKWQPTPVPLPGKSHGWRSLVGYSPWGRKESDRTERLHFLSFFLNKGFPGGVGGKELAWGDVRDTCLTPASGSSPGGGHGNPLQYSCLENPMDTGTRWAKDHSVSKSRTWLESLSRQINTIKKKNVLQL